MNDDKSREEFEAWHLKTFRAAAPDLDGDKYFQDPVWMAWQASRQAGWRPIEEVWRAFIAEVAQQTPEKPDYWSSCGQCERNANKAQDLLDAAPPKGE